MGRWQSFVLGGECTLFNSRMMIGDGDGYGSDSDCVECWR